MAFAKCKQCEHVFQWFAGKGHCLKNERCPKCGSSELKGGISIEEYVVGSV